MPFLSVIQISLTIWRQDRRMNPLTDGGLAQPLLADSDRLDYRRGLVALHDGDLDQAVTFCDRRFRHTRAIPACAAISCGPCWRTVSSSRLWPKHPTL